MTTLIQNPDLLVSDLLYNRMTIRQALNCVRQHYNNVPNGCSMIQFYADCGAHPDYSYQSISGWLGY